MKRYDNARNKTREKIRAAFWELYVKYNYVNMMSVKEIIGLAKINRSTFYYHYQHCGEILDELIEWLKGEIVDIYSSHTRHEGNFNNFYREMYDYFKLRKKYLIPLVCESRHPEFALWYRDNQREMFKEDIGLSHYRTDKRKNKIINISLAGIIEEQIQTFAYDEITVDESFNMEYGFLNFGIMRTLEERYAIKRKM